MPTIELYVNKSKKYVIYIYIYILIRIVYGVFTTIFVTFQNKNNSKEQQLNLDHQQYKEVATFQK